MTSQPRRDRRAWRQPQIFSTLLLVLTLLSPLRAQSQVGSLDINVRDAGGAAVADVTVTLTNVDTDRSVSLTTNADGAVRFTNLALGKYVVRVEARGFRTLVVPGVEVSLDKAQSLDLSLELRAIGTEVQVVSVEAGERPEVLSALPNLNNDLTPLLQVVPGAIATSPSTLGKIVIDGKGKDQQTVRLDGVDATPLVELPSGDSALDVLSSFQKPEVAFDLDNSRPTQSRAFAPMFGPGTGTVVDGVSYRPPGSWTAQFYGEHRNDALNARNYFDYDGKNALRRSRFGARGGGPLPGDHLFIYFGYDGVRGRTERNIYEGVPADAACGDCGAGPTAALMRGFLPAGTAVLPGASLNPDFLVARRRARESVGSDTWDVRLDVKPTSRLTPIFRYTRLAARNLVPDGVTGRRQRQDVLFNNALAQLIVSGTNVVHDIKFGLNQTGARVAVELPPALPTPLTQSLLTVGGTVNVTGVPGGAQTVPVATLGGLVKGSVGHGFRLHPTSYNLSYDQTRAVRFKGVSHDLFFGGEARFIRMTFDRLGGLTYAFPDAAALRSGSPGSVTLLSDLSAPSPFSDATGERHARQNYLLSYFQLTSKVRPSLTLTYGLRYDYFGVARERDNRAVVVDPEAGVILPPGSPFYRASRSNFQPRFGLALASDDRGLISNMTLRAGVGVYSGVPRVGDLLLPVLSDRYSTGLTGGTFPIDSAAVARGFVENPDTRQFQPLAFSRDFTSPERAYKWETSITKTLNGLYDLRLLYTGNVGRGLSLAGVANPIVGVQTNPDPSKPAIVVRRFDTVRDGLVFKPFGEFFFRSSDGRSSYNGLSVQLRRNSTSAADVNTSLPAWLRLGDLNVLYTLSRNVGNASGAVASNPLDFGDDYGYNASDARHSFTFTAVYSLWEAFGMDEHKGRSSPFFGWRVAPSLSARTGLPLAVTLDRPDIVYLDEAGQVFSAPALGRRAVINTPGGGASGGTRVPDLLPGVNPFLHNGLELLNPQAFAIPAPGAFGNLRRGQLRGPGSVQLDVALTRYLYMGERSSVDFRVDFYNLFNRANFGNPAASLPNALGASAADNQIQPGAPFARPAARSFGVITAADPGRLIQFSVVLKFK